MASPHNTTGDPGGKPEGTGCRDDAGVPWDNAPGSARIAALWQTAWGCLRHPFTFFSQVGASEDRWVALGFALVMDLLFHLLTALWIALFYGGLEGLEVVSVVLSPLRVLLSVWLGSEMMHGMLRLTGGATRSRSVTHRAVAYCYSTAVLAVVPIVGLRIGLALAAVYQVIALRQVHGAAWWKAVVAVAVTWAVLLGLVLLAALSGEVPDTAGG
jgi:hypothetical protein